MPAYLIAVILQICLIVVVVLFLLRSKKWRSKDSSASLNPSESEANTIVSRAVDNAGQIVKEAEKEALAIIEESKTETGAFKQKLINSFNSEVAHAADEFNRYLADLRSQSGQTQHLLDSSVTQKTDELVSELKKNLNDYFTKTQSTSLAAIEKEIEESKKELATYKVNQMKTVDENIVAIIENTLTHVLEKKLTLQDHTELVFEAFEKAKAERFIK